MFFPSLKYTVVHFHNPQWPWSTGRKQPKLGEHSGPLGRNSYYSVENCFVCAEHYLYASLVHSGPCVGGVVGVWGVWGVWGVGGVGSLLTFDIPQTALVATLDTYDLILK
jgi:hypothetical protein